MILRWKTVWCVLLVAIVNPALGMAGEVRTFTNQAGVAIEAELLEIVDQINVRIRREADGKEFELPIATLSLEDQQFLAGKLKAGTGTTEESGESTLVVDFISPDDRLNVFTTSASWSDARVGATRARFVVPAGKWIEYYLRESMGRKILIPYRGAAHWKFERREDESIWLSRDGMPMELVAIMIDYETGMDKGEMRRTLRSLEAPANNGVLNVLTDSSAHLEELDAIDPEIPVAVSSRYTLTSELARVLGRVRLVALATSIECKNLDDLKDLKHLECLVTIIRNPDPSDSVVLPDLPNLKHYVTTNGASLHKWPEILAKLPKLESLVAYRSSTIAEEGNSAPIDSFANNPRLDTVVFRDTSGVRLDVEALAETPNLKLLALSGESIANRDALPEVLAGMKSLQMLHIYDPEFDESALDALTTSGILSQVKDYNGYHVPLLEHCPKIELVSIQSTPSYPTLPDYSRFGKAPASLKKLSIEGALDRDFDKMKIPNPEAMLYISLLGCTVDRAELLYRYPEIEGLRIYSNSGRIKELDFSKWPKLSYAYFYRLSELENIPNFSLSPNLKYFSGRSLGSFGDFGEAAPNTSIRGLYLEDLPRLKSLESLSGLAGCQRLILYRMNQLESYKDFETRNPLRYLSVRDCENFDDETKNF